MIPQKTLKNLEWDKIVETLKEQIHSSSGLDALINLKFAQSDKDALSMLDETSEFKELIKDSPETAFIAFSDITQLVKKTSIGGTLEPSEIYEILTVILTAVKIKKVISGDFKKFPLLSSYASRIFELSELVKTIRKKINDNREIADNASFELKSIKNEIAVLNQRIIEKVKNLMSSSAYKNLLQEQFYTIRSDRFVLPFRADIKADNYGILHDTSQSGQTFFVEPKELIPLNNRLKALEKAKEIEIERILKELSEEIASNKELILQNYHVAGMLDFIGAKARLGILLNGTRPVVSEKRRLELKNAKHPVMILAGKNVVPNDIYFPDGCNGIIITGPNAGGKTVALKTAGLLILLSHAGIEIPASEGSFVPFVNTLVAEIGDDQSIISNLSTFSAHMLSLIKIFETIEKSDFVLLDEVVPGTDPKEGEALARGIILELLDRGVNIIATTHYGELKALSVLDERLISASVEFDENTLKPTYRLKTGIPGKSCAFDVASSLGLNRSVLDRARSFLAEDSSLLESALKRLERELQSAEDEKKRMEALFKSVSKLKNEFIANVALLTKSFDQITEKYRDKMKNMFLKRRDEIALLASEAQKRSKSGEVKYILKKHAELESKTLSALKTLKETDDTDFYELKKDEITAGKKVWIVDMKQEGVVLEPPDSKGMVSVHSGSLKFLIDRVRLKGFKKEAPAGGYKEAPLKKPEAEMPETIDLRGLTSEEAVKKLDLLLDRISLTLKNEVIVIHGHGTGVVKKGVRAYLKYSPYVKDFHPAPPEKGGDGATIIVLK